MDKIDLLRLEALAEAAYERMYDSLPPARPKDAYEDASQYFYQAIELARSLGLEGDVARLTARKGHVAAVYNSQFRGF